MIQRAINVKADRADVYQALDALPDGVFAAMLYAMSGANKVLALTCIDDPTPNAALDAASRPWMDKLDGKPAAYSPPAETKPETGS
jgi:hypothetical protein